MELFWIIRQFKTFFWENEVNYNLNMAVVCNEPRLIKHLWNVPNITLDREQYFYQLEQ